MVQIVNVIVSQTQAPIPPTLQRTGAFISQGGTNTATGSKTLLTQLADLTPILAGSIATTAITWAATSGGQVTVTTVSPHGFAVGELFTVAGVTPAGYNGTFVTIAGTTGSTIVYALVSNPGAASIQGTVTNEDVAELLSMATTFFSQGSNVSVYVLELGANTPAAGATSLDAYIVANPGVFYGFLVPRAWDANSTFLGIIAHYEATTAKVYFWVTTTTGTYTSYTSLMKCVITKIEAPVIGTTEFGLAADFWITLNYNPSNTNRVTPLSFSFEFGVTPYPTIGNAALRQTLKTAGVNISALASEGGLSDVMLIWGTNMDGRPFNYWYSVDWAQINASQALANAVINGSNNPINPLYYNQDGINRLEGVLAATMGRAVTFGLALGTVIQTELDTVDFDTALNNGDFAGRIVVNAVPFVPYSIANPSHYRLGIYNGLSITYTPLRGFDSITFNINVTDFVAQ